MHLAPPRRALPPQRGEVTNERVFVVNPGIRTLLGVCTRSPEFGLPESVRHRIFDCVKKATRPSLSEWLVRSFPSAKMLQQIRCTIPAAVESRIPRSKCGRRLLHADAHAVMSQEMSETEQQTMADDVLALWRANGEPTDIARDFECVHESMDRCADDALWAHREKMNRTLLARGWSAGELARFAPRPFNKRAKYCCN